FGGNTVVDAVLEDVREFSGNIRKQRKTEGGGSAFQRVSRNIEALNVIGTRIRVLENTRVLPQELQAFRRLLQENLYEFSAVLVQARSCATAARRDGAAF